MAVGEDGEVLAPAPGQVVGQPGAGQGVGDRVGREARPALLAIGDDRRASPLQVLDRVPYRQVLLGLELVVGDLPGVVLGVRLLQPTWARQRAHRFGGNAGSGPRIVVSHGSWFSLACLRAPRCAAHLKETGLSRTVSRSISP